MIKDRCNVRGDKDSRDRKKFSGFMTTVFPQDKSSRLKHGDILFQNDFQVTSIISALQAQNETVPPLQVKWQLRGNKHLNNPGPAPCFIYSRPLYVPKYRSDPAAGVGGGGGAERPAAAEWSCCFWTLESS